MEKVEMLQRSFENYLRVKLGQITGDIILADIAGTGVDLVATKTVGEMK